MGPNLTVTYDQIRISCSQSVDNYMKNYLKLLRTLWYIDCTWSLGMAN